MSRTNIFSDVANKLQKGAKVTILKFSEFGFPVSIETTIHKVQVKPWAQYNETLEILHKPKRKRTIYGNRILPDNEVIIYDGWLSIDIDKLTYNVEENKNVLTKVSKYHCFDERYLEDIVTTIKQPPLVKLNI